MRLRCDAQLARWGRQKHWVIALALVLRMRNRCLLTRDRVRSLTMRTPYRKLEKTKLFNSRRISDDSCPNRAGSFRTAIRQCTVLEPHGQQHRTRTPCDMRGSMRLNPSTTEARGWFSTLFTGQRRLGRSRDASYLAPPHSGRVEARIGLRLMHDVSSTLLSFRTAGFPRYGWKVGM